MTPLMVECTIWLDVPIEQAWKATTEPTHLEQWYAPGYAWEIPALEAGATVKFHNTETEILSATIEVLDPPYQLTLRWEPDSSYHALTLITTFRLQAENGGTRFTIQETGYEALPDEIRQKWMEDTESGYNGSLHLHLRKYLESISSEEDTKMSEAWTVKQSIWVEALPERVWTMITTPEHLMQWWAPNLWEIPVLEVGGTVWFGAEGDMSTATIAVLDAPRQFTLQWQADEQFPALVTTYLLEAENNGTRVTVTEAGFETLPPESRQKIFDRTANGYSEVVQDLKKYIEAAH